MHPLAPTPDPAERVRDLLLELAEALPKLISPNGVHPGPEPVLSMTEVPATRSASRDRRCSACAPAGP